MALRLGATRLPHLGGGCPVYADPAGHPFCLCFGYPANELEQALRGQLGGITFDCFDSPRALAAFYAELLDMPERMEDEDGWVTIRAKDPTPRDLAFDLSFDLAFQGANGQRPQWLDPERPPQVHLDIEVDDLAAAENLVARLGATGSRTWVPSAPSTPTRRDTRLPLHQLTEELPAGRLRHPSC